MSAIRVERIDGVPIAYLTEDIDATNAAAVQERLADSLGPEANGLVVDLSEVRYLDSGGLDMLLRFSDRLDRRRATLMLVIPESSQLNRLAAIVGLPQAVATYPTLLAAREAAAELPTGAKIAPDSVGGASPVSRSEQP